MKKTDEGSFTLDVHSTVLDRLVSSEIEPIYTAIIGSDEFATSTPDGYPEMTESDN